MWSKARLVNCQPLLYKIVVMQTNIKITYRHIINNNAETLFEQQVHKASYEEFLLKSQAYNAEGKFNSFSEMKANDGRANSLHYKSGFAVAGFIELLKNQFPFFTDTGGKPVIFDEYRFEVIESDISNKEKHMVALHFTTPILVLKQSFGNFLVLGNEDETNSGDSFTIQLQQGVSITYLKEKD